MEIISIFIALIALSIAFKSWSQDKKVSKHQYMATIYNIIASGSDRINKHSSGAVSNPQCKDFSLLVSHIITTKQLIKHVIDYSNGIITQRDINHIIEHYRLSLHIDILNMIDTLHQNPASAFGVNVAQPHPNAKDHAILTQQQLDIISLFKEYKL
jgi:hypothetical protein